MNTIEEILKTVSNDGTVVKRNTEELALLKELDAHLLYLKQGGLNVIRWECDVVHRMDDSGVHLFQSERTLKLVPEDKRKEAIKLALSGYIRRPSMKPYGDFYILIKEVYLPITFGEHMEQTRLLYNGFVEVVENHYGMRVSELTDGFLDYL
jgi:hypothetical protein